MDARNRAIPLTLDELTELVIGKSIKIHQKFGPGLLESVYEALIAHYLLLVGVRVVRQHPVAIAIDGIEIQEGFRVDLLIDDRLVVELKSVNRLSPIDSKQTLTYIRLMKLPLALLINFGQETLIHGLKRIVNNLNPGDSPTLRVNKPPVAK